MTKTFSIVQARKKLGELADRVQYSGEEFEIVKYGKPVASLSRSKLGRKAQGVSSSEFERELKEIEQRYGAALEELAKH